MRATKIIDTNLRRITQEHRNQRPISTPSQVDTTIGEIRKNQLGISTLWMHEYGRWMGYNKDWQGSFGYFGCPVCRYYGIEECENHLGKSVFVIGDLFQCTQSSPNHYIGLNPKEVKLIRSPR